MSGEITKTTVQKGSLRCEEIMDLCFWYGRHQIPNPDGKQHSSRETDKPPSEPKYRENKIIVNVFVHVYKLEFILGRRLDCSVRSRLVLRDWFEWDFRRLMISLCTHPIIFNRHFTGLRDSGYTHNKEEQDKRNSGLFEYEKGLGRDLLF